MFDTLLESELTQRAQATLQAAELARRRASIDSAHLSLSLSRRNSANSSALQLANVTSFIGSETGSTTSKVPIAQPNKALNRPRTSALAMMEEASQEDSGEGEGSDAGDRDDESDDDGSSEDLPADDELETVQVMEVPAKLIDFHVDANKDHCYFYFLL